MDCGKSVPKEHSRKHFIEKYAYKVIEWNGYVMRVDASERN